MGFKCKNITIPRCTLEEANFVCEALFGFLLSFYTNPWVEQSGYLNAYGAMAGIAAFVLILWVPLFYFGKAVRHSTWHWPVLSYIHWKDDREVGE